MGVKPDYQSRYTKWSHTTGLSVSLWNLNQTGCVKEKRIAHLLNTSDVFGDVFNADGIFYGQSM